MNRHPDLELPQVTLCAADSVHPALAARALDISAAQCAFADAILFSHEAVPSSARTVLIPRLQSGAEYSAFMVKDLASHVTTPWVLVVQWDGYVVNAAAWSHAFLTYDYIGACWPFHQDGMNVGNGGFSLRSAKLLQALADPRVELIPGMNEDDLICRAYRPFLETEYGIRFAPAEVAARFSYEHTRPTAPTFGFHAAYNMWRHVDDEALMDIVRTLNERTFTSTMVMQLLMVYCELRKFPCVKTMYERYRRLWSPQQLKQNMVNMGLPGDVALTYIDICEKTANISGDSARLE
jgi:hypothetical protein